MPKSYADFETKKTVHFNVTREAHSRLRIECFKYRLSMQEVFEEIAQLIAAESPEMMLFLDDLATKKREKTIKKLSNADADSVLNIIESENPLSENK